MLDWLNQNFLEYLLLPATGMTHDGLPGIWVISSFCMLLAIFILYFKHSPKTSALAIHLTQLPGVGSIINTLLQSPIILIVLRVLTAAVFVVVIAAGLFGTPVAERNLATTLTWTLWWTGIIISIYFVGSSWCAICPWDTLANILVKARIWFRPKTDRSLGMRVPRLFRNVWPASTMFIVLTWFELGVGITLSPYATAVLALSMVVLATLSLAVFERKAFCRYFCSVGRTIGFYAGMSPLAIEAKDATTCHSCTTLDCYRGNEKIEPCPTHLVIGRHNDINYCTNCGACVFSCPYHNVAWHLKKNPLPVQARQKINTSEAWFILILFALTLFHGFTMLPAWEKIVQSTAIMLNDKGQLLLTFTLLMVLAICLPIIVYSIFSRITHLRTYRQYDFSRLFNLAALPLLPIAFSYHIAHNLTHLVRESNGFLQTLLNPFGLDTLPLTMIEKHARHMNPIVSDNITFTLQAALIVIGYAWAVKMLSLRFQHMNLNQRDRYPLYVLLFLFSSLSLWLLMQPMTMRM